jgi:glutaconate CoA-transferase, subunit B
MACAIARALRDGERIGVGVNSPIPAAAVLLARRTHAPSLRFWCRGVAGAEPFVGSKEFFDFAQRGKLGVFFLSGVQIDARGRINMHVLGDYERPRRRFPGAFGSAVLYPIVPRVILFRKEHSPRVFVPQLDFVTAAGVPDRVVTSLAVLGFDRNAGRLALESYHPGQSIQSVRDATGFHLLTRPMVRETSPPSAEELGVLREEVYPLLADVYPAFVEDMAGVLPGTRLAHRAHEQHDHQQHQHRLDHEDQVERLPARGAGDVAPLGHDADQQPDGGGHGAHSADDPNSRPH